MMPLSPHPLLLVGCLLLLALCLAVPGTSAEAPLVIPVWPGKTPHDSGSFGEEKFRVAPDATGGTTHWLRDVTKPTLTLYRPPKEKDTGAAMIVCPGGGYWELAWDLEGEEVAAWLNSVGITGIVLKYRVPRRPGESEKLPAAGPTLDAQRAVSLVRSRAAEWDIDPHRIGMVGFSVGGHLTLTTATHFDRRAYEPIDAVDQVSCRPDFAVAVYPGLVVLKGTEVLAPYVRIPAGTPPVLLVHAADDEVASADNSVLMYQALRKAGISTELHVYASGGHGFGVRKSDRPCSTWTERCLAWLGNQGMLKW